MATASTPDPSTEEPTTETEPTTSTTDAPEDTTTATSTTGDETAVDSTESTEASSETPSEENDTIAHTQTDDTSADPNAVTTGVAVDAGVHPDEVILSEGQTDTVEGDGGFEYEQPKFRAVRNQTNGAVGISLFNWVGPEAIVIPEDDIDDFKAFVSSL